MMNEWMCYTHWFQQAGKMRRMLHDEKQRRRFDAILDQLMEMDAEAIENGVDAEGKKCYEMLFRRCMAYVTGSSAYGTDDMWKYVQTYIDTHPLDGTADAQSAVYGWYLFPVYCAHLYDRKNTLERGLLKSEEYGWLLDSLGHEETEQLVAGLWRMPSEQILGNRNALRKILLCTFDGLTEPLYRLLIESPIQMEVSWIPQCQYQNSLQ